MKFTKLLLLVLFKIVFAEAVYADQGSADPFSVTGFPIPRFVSLSSDKVFMRTGPGKKYPVKWEYKKKNLPVEVILEFDTWRKIKDIDGETGWVHQSLLSGRRFAIVQSDKNVNVHRKADLSSRVLIQVESKASGKVEECQHGWCLFEIQGYQGWVEQKYLWGVYEDEKFN